jgi:2-polyprenyl-3-methyl-5-hydroxy-6-metoxy-1,4-benzoquinol methylase
MTPGPSRWTERDVRDLLDRERFGYQRVELPYGLHTGGDDRSATARAIFPDDMTGKTVLDVGSSNGYFCFEALRRGARSAVGLEVNPDVVRKARLLADCLGAPAEFRVGDVERDRIDGRFDYVVCLNVLHHVKDPIHVLDHLAAATRERLILEVATFGRRDRRKLGMSRLVSVLLRRLPVLYVDTTGRGKHGQTFFFAPGAIRNLLTEHRKMFARVDVRPSEHKDRFLAVAHRRRIGRLVIVAGPTSAGKSTLIERLLAGAWPELAARLDLGDPRSWRLARTGGLGALAEPRIDRLLFEYDIVHPHVKSAQTYDRHEPLDIVECAEDTTVLTVWTPPAVLSTQLERGEIQPRTRRGVYRGSHRRLRVRSLYRDPRQVLRFYEDWLAFCERKGCRRLMVSAHDGIDITSVEAWRARVAAAPPTAPGPA